jgi:hypothetical protein
MSRKLQTITPILGEHLVVLGTALGMLVIYARPATASTVDTANATVSCTAQSTNSANFNGTPIRVGDFIWFNANFKGQGIPGNGATLSLTNSTISFRADQSYTFQVPNALITFSRDASCATTTFDSASNTWMTTVPLSGTDDIFLAGLAIPVPVGFANVNGKVLGPVVWTGTFATNIPGVNIQWKWGAAVYTCSDSGYNEFAPKASHQNACDQRQILLNNGDQAGTPEDLHEKQCVVGGATGGGGSNWTGSWSGTMSVSPVCH